MGVSIQRDLRAPLGLGEGMCTTECHFWMQVLFILCGTSVYFFCVCTAATFNTTLH